MWVSISTRMTSVPKTPVYRLCVIFRGTSVPGGIPNLSDCWRVSPRGECRPLESLDFSDYFGDVTGDSTNQVLFREAQTAFIL